MATDSRIQAAVGTAPARLGTIGRPAARAGVESRARLRDPNARPRWASVLLWFGVAVFTLMSAVRT